ncbi:helicase and polymerase-containing protein TEBICHI isoform X5 [Musa acuminata AAA Group]|uniref:helicase and polymerase-containing protein TEBICHI isoform X5 n=1 Tax=Musa acuminata AAA Group TaxID=214697 RepID=UPI0031DCFE0F
MASDPSRARIDQFFASRKRKTPLPKDGKPDKESRSPVAGSPGAKGTLDGFLARSPDVVSVAGHGQTRNSPRHDLVKRNLVSEIDSIADAVRKPDLVSDSAETGSSSRTAPGQESGSGDHLDFVRPPSAVVVAEKDSPEAVLACETSNEGNLELKRFAANFLSLYCSDLPSAESVPLEPDQKGQKRNGSPSLVAVCSKTLSKRQCALDHSDMLVEAETTSHAFPEPPTHKLHPVAEEVVNNKVPGVKLCSEIDGVVSLRRCTATPDGSFTKTRHYMIGMCCNNRVTNDTPKSALRCSIFSPGDEFWSEAIQVADGLLPAASNLPEGLQFSKCGTSDNKLRTDESSCRATNGVLDSGSMASKVSQKIGEKPIVENKTSLKISQHIEVSPLPVKHFDFSCEDSFRQRGVEKNESAIGVSVEPANSNYIQQKHLDSLLFKKHSEDMENCLAPKENSDFSFCNSGGSSSSTGKSYQTGAGSDLDACPGKGNLPTQENNMGQIRSVRLPVCLPGTGYDSANLERKQKNKLIANGNYEEFGTPSSSVPPKYRLQLHSWLPPEVCNIYKRKGISELYPWQVECLLVDGVLEKRNLVYCATTSSGKSFVAEILMLRQVLSTGKMALLVLPYVSLCAEKAEHLELLLEPLGKHVRSFYGNQGGGSLPKDTSVAVCTIEKANSLINRLLEEGRLSELGIIVIDELHMAALYQTDFRPVPLEEFVKVGNTIFDKKMNVVRIISKTADLGGKDPDHIIELCNEVVQDGHSVLLFCSSRKGCESTARHVARFSKKFSDGIHEDCEFNDASAAIEALRRSPAGLDPILEQTLPSGVAYHHAGLTVEEREIIETCYRKGLVRVLTATSTLAAGVNLPARRVIFRQPRVGRDFIDGTRYRQMAGRAGRTGIDTKGESILICKADEAKRIAAILNDCCPPLHSCLSEDKNGMTHAIMEVVAGGIVQTAHDINRYVRCTLLNSTKPFQDVVKSAQDSLRWLCHKKFLKWNEDTKLYSTTPLGRAAFGSSLTPEESLVVLDDLLRAREGFVLASDLHLVYLVTPINVEVEPDWELYYERFMEMCALDQSVGNRVGVTEPFLMRMAHGAPMPVQNRLRGKKSGLNEKFQTRNSEVDNGMLSNEQTLRVSKRFYVALMLSRLVQEVPVSDVCEAFRVARGMLQALQESAGRFALMVSVFCERLGWHDLQGLVAKFQNRVSFGVRAEIVELTTIPHVKGSRARALYKAGLRTPLAIAEASVTEIVKAMFDSSAWTHQDDSKLRRMQFGVAKKIKNSARKIVLDQAEESRLAAFSALKSLGVHVPQFSRPLLSDIVESPGGGKMPCFGEDPSKDVQPAESLLADHKIVNSDSASPIGNREILVETMKAAGETSSAIPMQYNGNDTDVGSLIKRETANHANAAIEMRVECNPGPGDKDGLNGNTSNKKSEGPISASSFPGGFDCFLDKWASVNEFCFDLHFLKRPNSQSSVFYEVFGLAVCWDKSPVYYCNLSKDLAACSNLDKFDIWELARSRWNRITKIMGQDGVRKTTWNLKIQIQALKFPCASVQKIGWLNGDYIKWDDIKIIDDSFILLPSVSVHNGVDLCLVSWILWPDEESKSTPNLEKVVKRRLSNEAAAAANRDGRWRNQMRKAAHNGCCRRVAQVRALGSVLWKLLVAEGLVEVLMKIENPLVAVLADMEHWGMAVDMEACLRERHVLMRKLKELEKEAYKLAGMAFSLYTAADIANVLYTHLKLPIPQGRNKGKLHPSTDKHSLDQLRGQHPIISVIKEHRTLSKLLNSTLGSICSRAQLCVKSQKYKIQGHWLQTSTATGRLSMEEPNLQCVQHMVVFTTHRVDQNSSSSSECDHHLINARDIFVPTQDNWLLLTADYSQIELRIMAHFSKDLALIELLSKPDGDVFTMIASRWTCKPESAINSEERDYTKRLIYGILYGMGANTLGEQLQCSPEEAAEKIQSFKNSFPGVSAWLSEAVASCRQKGYVETLMGRKRFLSKIKFGNSKEKAKAQRQAVNSICQGSAADIIKMAMINIHSVIVDGRSNGNLNNDLAVKLSNVKGRCRIILQVHDELVLEVDPGIIKEAGILLQMNMENATSLLVPLRVKLMVGKAWGSLEPFRVEPSNSH